jgi:hypothetical protein
MYQTAPNRIVFRQYGPSGQAFMACALSKSLLKSTQTLKNYFILTSQNAWRLVCQQSVSVCVLCFFATPCINVSKSTNLKVISKPATKTLNTNQLCVLSALASR